MIEHKVKAATCRVVCAEQSGTGWLIAKNRVISARHCVLASLDEGKSVELFFPNRGDVPVSGKIIDDSEESDVCLLSLATEIAVEPLSSSPQRPREGEAWQAFGYPQGKIALGHRLSGTVEQVLDTPKLKVDLDLSVNSPVALRAYQGLSGAAVICEGAAVGLIRLKLDGSVAALSLHQLKGFLADNGITMPSESSASAAPLLADRGTFSQAFAEALKSRAGSYLFLEGAHGYGKSTFCRNFQSSEQTLINLGAYYLSDTDSALGPDYRAQPQVFLDWLTTTISGLITGQPPRKAEKSYAEQIRQTAQYLDTFSQFCAKAQRRGVFFLDGLNEIPPGPMLDN